MKNQQLMTIVKQKQQELHDTQKIADQAKTMKKQLSKLEEIIDDLQSKNKELNELLNKKMIERAESYKQQVVDFLNKPKAYECDLSQGARRSEKRSEKAEFSNRYRKLGEDLNKDTMSPGRRDKQEQSRVEVEFPSLEPARQSFNEGFNANNARSGLVQVDDLLASVQEAKKEQRFESEYARKLHQGSVDQVNINYGNEGARKYVHNSEKKRAHFEGYNIEPMPIDKRSAHANHRGGE